MNTKTAQKLNGLLELSQPLALVADYVIGNEAGSTYFVATSIEEAGKDLAKKCRAVCASYTAQARREELIAAAKERRTCYVGRDDFQSGLELHRKTQDKTNINVREVRIALPQLQAIIAADNARRLAEYEAYRIAVEQGVAVPEQY